MVDDFHGGPGEAEQFREKAHRGDGDLKPEQPAKKGSPTLFDQFDDKQRQGDHDEVVNEIVDEQIGVLPEAFRGGHQNVQEALAEDQPDGIDNREQAEVHQAAVGGLALE